MVLHIRGSTFFHNCYKMQNLRRCSYFESALLRSITFAFTFFAYKYFWGFQFSPWRLHDACEKHTFNCDTLDMKIFRHWWKGLMQINNKISIVFSSWCLTAFQTLLYQRRKMWLQRKNLLFSLSMAWLVKKKEANLWFYQCLQPASRQWRHLK